MNIPIPAKESLWTLIRDAVAVSLVAIPVLSMPHSTWQDSLLFWVCLLNVILWGIVVIFRAYFFVANKSSEE